MEVSELLWNASSEQLKSGFIEEDEMYICITFRIKVKGATGKSVFSDDGFVKGKRQSCTDIFTAS